MSALKIAERIFGSRLFLGTGKFSAQSTMREAVLAAETELVTVALRRVDLAANAASLGAIVHKPTTRQCLVQALEQARAAERTTVVYVPDDPTSGVPNYDSWWEVPVAEVSDQSSVQAARRAWEQGKTRQRYFL